MAAKTTSKLEFMVENIKDIEQLKTALSKEPGITKVQVVKERVILETELPCSVAGDLIQNISGSRTVLQGFGENGTAVAMMEGSRSRGIIRLSGAGTGNGGLVDGTIDGLPPGVHILNVHVAGDISQGCESLGPVWEPTGNLGKITAEANGRASFKFVVPELQIGQIVGRSLAIATNSHSRKLACGVIARSAGVFENSKKICACDGVTVWDERNVPVAGQGRRQNDLSKDEHYKNKL